MSDPRRSHCPTNFFVEHAGDRWTLLIIRDLLFKKKRYYQEFLSAAEGISTNILATRLRRMEEDGLIGKGPDPDDARRVQYFLTDKGVDLVRVMVEINRWSAKHDPETEVPAEYSDHMARDYEGLITLHRAQAVRGGG